MIYYTINIYSIHTHGMHGKFYEIHGQVKVVQAIQERAILLEMSLLSVRIYQRGKEKIPDVKKRNRFVFIPSFNLCIFLPHNKFIRNPSPNLKS